MKTTEPKAYFDKTKGKWNLQLTIQSGKQKAKRKKRDGFASKLEAMEAAADFRAYWARGGTLEESVQSIGGSTATTSTPQGAHVIMFL